MPTPTIPVATAFLSCSVDPSDRPVVQAVANLLTKRGFQCRTVGRNWSAIGQPDDVMRKLVDESDCLVGIATARLSAVDHRNPNQTLTLATPYLLQETAMAHQRDLPFLIFKATDVDLQGVTARNLYVPIERTVGEQGRLRLIPGTDRAKVRAALDDLMAKAVARRKQRESDEFWGKAKNLGLVLAAGGAAYTALDVLSRPDCFGDFYHADPECKACGSRLKCKGKKAEDGR